MIMVKSRKGFTIIEVVLVLAIAGLIFLMVFVALPALQRSQRNTQRKRDAERFATAIDSYIANNNKLPFSYGSDSQGRYTVTDRFDTGFVTRYIDSSCTFSGRTSSSSYGDMYYEYDGCGSEFTDPNGDIYKVIVLNGNGSGYRYTDRIGHVLFAAGSQCGSDEGIRAANAKPKAYAIFVELEGGQRYCVDNT
jgi:prepilin-type N-terminal cleavage/methylation domain-containing protein